ncbi:hypothetical protein RhoFasB10_00511 [Rhodococcus sp. B10]|nr:hypothetical protein [Rhodococcus sp. B10]
MSQAELSERVAQRLGTPFHQQTILKIEKGTRSLKFNEAIEIARVLEVSLDELGNVGRELGRMITLADVHAKILDNNIEALGVVSDRFEKDLVEVRELHAQLRAAGDSDPDSRAAANRLLRVAITAIVRSDRATEWLQERTGQIREELLKDDDSEA